MRRLCFEIADDVINDESLWNGTKPFTSGIRFAAGALHAIQEDLEAQLIKMFREANALAIANNRTTLLGRDIKTAKELRKISFSGAFYWAVPRK